MVNFNYIGRPCFLPDLAQHEHGRYFSYCVTSQPSISDQKTGCAFELGLNECWYNYNPLAGGFPSNANFLLTLSSSPG